MFHRNRPCIHWFLHLECHLRCWFSQLVSWLSQSFSGVWRCPPEREITALRKESVLIILLSHDNVSEIFAHNRNLFTISTQGNISETDNSLSAFPTGPGTKLSGKNGNFYHWVEKRSKHFVFACCYLRSPGVKWLLLPGDAVLHHFFSDQAKSLLNLLQLNSHLLRQRRRFLSLNDEQR